MTIDLKDSYLKGTLGHQMEYKGTPLDGCFLFQEPEEHSEKFFDNILDSDFASEIEELDPDDFLESQGYWSRSDKRSCIQRKKE